MLVLLYSDFNNKLEISDIRNKINGIGNITLFSNYEFIYINPHDCISKDIPQTLNRKITKKTLYEYREKQYMDLMVIKTLDCISRPSTKIVVVHNLAVNSDSLIWFFTKIKKEKKNKKIKCCMIAVGERAYTSMSTVMGFSISKAMNNEHLLKSIEYSITNKSLSMSSHLIKEFPVDLKYISYYNDTWIETIEMLAQRSGITPINVIYRSKGSNRNDLLRYSGAGNDALLFFNKGYAFIIVLKFNTIFKIKEESMGIATSVGYVFGSKMCAFIGRFELRDGFYVFYITDFTGLWESGTMSEIMNNLYKNLDSKGERFIVTNDYFNVYRIGDGYILFPIIKRNKYKTFMNSNDSNTVEDIIVTDNHYFNVKIDRFKRV